jgi:molybdopterin molybdotransferase
MRAMAEALLPIAEARARVLAATTRLDALDVAVAHALDRVLAADVTAAHDVAPFASSAMDGFAVAPGPAGRRLRIAGEARAGSPCEVPLGEGEAIRISTGAVIPEGADAVVMVERTTESGDGTVTVEADVEPGQNVRAAAEDLQAGTVVLRAGTLLGPAELGVAVAAGAATVPCARRPRVAVLATGDELVVPGSPLRPGQIHDTNSVTLAALARRAGADVITATRVADTPAATRTAIATALSTADVVVLSGGVSVGPHDHVKPALVELGVEESFWRVALKPGKPTWFGTRAGRLVFGLPGNPVSSMVTFLLFARPALAALQGAPGDVPRERAVLAEALPRHPARDECVRVRLADGRAMPTGPQGSHVLSSMLGAAALAIVPMGEGELAAGDEVEIERI